MCRKYAYGIRILFLIALLFVLLSGCGTTTGKLIGNTSPGSPPWASLRGNAVKYHYRYFPDYSVYLDEQRRIFFYPSDGEWQMSVWLPSSIRITVNDFVTLDMHTDKPYEYHNDVVKRYPPGQQRKKDQYRDQDRYQDKDEDEDIYNEEENNKE
jgi:hypothetical protein